MNLTEYPPSSVAVITDVERDDLDAISVPLRMGKVGVIVICRGSATDLRNKTIIVNQLVAAVGAKNVTVTVDSPTENEGMHNFPSTKELEAVFEVIPAPNEKAFPALPVLEAFVISGLCRAVVSIAPPRILLELVKTKRCPDIEQHLSTIGFFGSGSFNFREMGDQRAEMLRIISLFKSPFIVETFHSVGEQNSASAAAFPRLFSPPRSTTDEQRFVAGTAYEIVRRLGAAWDTFIYVDAVQTCAGIIGPAYLHESISDRERIIADFEAEQKTLIDAATDEKEKTVVQRRIDRAKRNHKAMRSTYASDGTQTVFADHQAVLALFGLIPDKTIPAQFGFTPSGYSTLTATENAVSARVYKDVGLQRAVDTFCDLRDMAFSSAL